MHFVIIGSGAVGGYFGARLAQNNKVTFVARGKHLAAIQKNGLVVESIAGNMHLSAVNAVESIENVKDVDVIILAVKSFQLKSAIAKIKPLLKSNTRIIPLLNGINTTQNLIEAGVDEQYIYGGLAKIISSVKNPGIISHTGAVPHITLGLLSKVFQQEEQCRLMVIVDVFKLAQISVGISKNISVALWRKFIFVAAWGALATVENMPVGELRTNKRTRSLLENIINEYALIANAEQVCITNDMVKETLEFINSLPSHSQTSMQRDITHHQKSEFKVLVEYPFLIAKSHEIPIPILEGCYQQLLQQIRAQV